MTVKIDMEMPESCTFCPFRETTYDFHPECFLTKKEIEKYAYTHRNGRHPRCPLQEVKE